MVLVGVLDHGDLELSRQANDRGDRKDVHRDPAAVEILGRVDVDACCFGAREDGLKAAAGIDDKDTDGDKRGEFHNGLEGNRGDNAMVLLLGVDIAGAEQDGEERHAGRDTERKPDIVDARKASLAEFAGAGDRLDRGGHRLELQRDIGRDGDHSDNGDENGESARLAEARGEQVRDRRDALVVAYPYEPAQHKPPADEDQRGSQIDGEIFEPVAGCRTNRAVERPARAVDRDGERVDERRAQKALAGATGLPVGKIGDDEEQTDIGDPGGDHEVGREHHGPSSSGPAPGSRGRLRPSQRAPSTSPAQATNR